MATRVELTAEVLRLMNEWLDRIASDRSADGAAARVARNRPPDLTDACWDGEGKKIVEPRDYDGAGQCNRLYPPHADPRMAAGAPLTDDILKCALKPVDPKDYAQALTGDQLSRLKAIFPSGVCDYTRLGIEQQTVTETWRR